MNKNQGKTQSLSTRIDRVQIAAEQIAANQEAMNMRVARLNSNLSRIEAILEAGRKPIETDNKGRGK